MELWKRDTGRRFTSVSEGCLEERGADLKRHKQERERERRGIIEKRERLEVLRIFTRVWDFLFRPEREKNRVRGREVREEERGRKPIGETKKE